MRRYDLRAHARPFLEAVSERTGETSHLLVLAGAHTLFLDSAEGGQSVRTTGRVGASFPAHSTSGGKALLAELEPAALRELYPDADLPMLTERTLSQRGALEADLVEVRERGYAINAGESDPHILSVAAAVRDASGAARFAISISMPAFRADPKREADTHNKTRQEAGRAIPSPPGGSAPPAG